MTSSLILTPIVAWVVDGATFVLHQTAHVVAQTTAPQLSSTWFSSTYWRVAGIGAVLTLPFLFAAAVQALVSSDLGVLLRAALGYLPLALLTVTVAAPLTMLLLAASDQLSAVVSSAAGNQSVAFLARTTSLLGGIGFTFTSPFVVFLMALLTVAGAVVLWITLLVRETAVYVIVLMLPLAFAAFVWPARRIWAIRSVELLIALILSKFAIVAVLSLGGAALGHATNSGVTAVLAGGVLMALAALAPWALLRLIPLTELASAAAGSLTSGSQAVVRHVQRSGAWAVQGEHWATKAAQMRHSAEETEDRDGARATKDNVDANAGREASASGPAEGSPAGPAEAASTAADRSTPAPAPVAARGATSPADTATAPSDTAIPPAPAGTATASADTAIPPAGSEVAGAHSDADRFTNHPRIDLENPPSAEPYLPTEAGGAEIVDLTPPPQPDPEPPPEERRQ